MLKICRDQSHRTWGDFVFIICILFLQCYKLQTPQKPGSSDGTAVFCLDLQGCNSGKPQDISGRRV